MPNHPVNSNLMRRVYLRMARASRRRISSAPRPAGCQSRQPNTTGSGRRTTHYAWCDPLDGWCYCFNVPDIFTRQWIAYRFGTPATASIAVDSLVEARCHRQAGLLQADPLVRQRIPVRWQKVPKGRLHPRHQPEVHPGPHTRAERPHRIVPRNPQARVHLAARPRQPPACRACLDSTISCLPEYHFPIRAGGTVFDGPQDPYWEIPVAGRVFVGGLSWQDVLAA